MKIETKAQLNFLRMSPQKVRLIAGLIRGLNVSDALTQLTFSGKRAAHPVKKLLESAIANARHNHNAKEETLKIETIFVNEGPTLRRWMPRAMGRATPLRKRSSHITIVLSGEADESKEVKKEVKKENKKADKKEEKKETKVAKEIKTTKVTKVSDDKKEEKK